MLECDMASMPLWRYTEGLNPRPFGKVRNTLVSESINTEQPWQRNLCSQLSREYRGNECEYIPMGLNSDDNRFLDNYGTLDVLQRESTKSQTL